MKAAVLEKARAEQEMKQAEERAAEAERMARNAEAMTQRMESQLNQKMSGGDEGSIGIGVSFDGGHHEPCIEDYEPNPNPNPDPNPNPNHALRTMN